jgi:hypothetical protein
MEKIQLTELRDIIKSAASVFEVMRACMKVKNIEAAVYCIFA